MIVSASRRTDIPALYAAWLLGRIEAGHCAVPHPFRPSRFRRVDLRPSPAGSMDALVLWTRDPGPLADALPLWEGRGIRTLWLVTVTGYPAELEPWAPPLEAAAASVRQIAAAVGPERIAWRYDPILLCSGLGMDRRWHRENFLRIFERLAGAVGRCVISVYDDYAKARRRLAAAGLTPDPGADPLPVAADLAAFCARSGLPVRSCCERLDPAGVQPGACVDGALLDEIWGLGVGSMRDPGQRSGCGCAPSVDIGVYGTCTHGCLYCYATGSAEAARARRLMHDPRDDSLIGASS